MKYFICGFSGAGKSTLLRRISESGKYPDYLFVDLDLYIASQHRDEAGSLGELIEKKGWEWFRAAEKETLANLLKSPNIWIALGGGTLTEETAQNLLADADKSIKGYWLDTDFETCWKRIQNDKNRPLVKRGESVLKHLYNERSEIFKKFERIRVE